MILCYILWGNYPIYINKNAAAAFHDYSPHFALDLSLNFLLYAASQISPTRLLQLQLQEELFPLLDGSKAKKLLRPAKIWADKSNKLQWRWESQRCSSETLRLKEYSQVSWWLVKREDKCPLPSWNRQQLLQCRLLILRISFLCPSFLDMIVFIDRSSQSMWLELSTSFNKNIVTFTQSDIQQQQQPPILDSSSRSPSLSTTSILKG